MSFNTFLTRSPFGRIPVDFSKQQFDFIDERADGGLDKSLHPGIQFGPWRFNFNSTKSKPLGDCTFETGSIVRCVDHGIPIVTNPLTTSINLRLSTTGTLPTGLSNAEYYTPLVLDSDTLQLYLLGVLADFDLDDVGDAELVRRGLAYDFTSATVDAWVKTSVEDDDSDILVNLMPSFSSDIKGQVIIDLSDTATKDLATATAYWDMVIKLALQEKQGPWVSGRFDINKLVTHNFGP